MVDGKRGSGVSQVVFNLKKIGRIVNQVLNKLFIPLKMTLKSYYYFHRRGRNRDL